MAEKEKAAAMPTTGRLTMVERVARAIYDAWAAENEVTHTWDEMIAAVAISSAEDAPTLHRMRRLAFAEARAAIEAMREPTPEMCSAYSDAIDPWGPAPGYRLMIDAALSEADHG